MSSKIILILIFLLALGLRFYDLGGLPPSLNWDEVSHGYNAYSILKTGQDEWGQFLPLANFRAYGDYPLPLYVYLTIPWIVIFGLNAFAIRATSALLGSLLVLITYFLAKKIIKSDFLSLIGAFLIALSPWSLMLSREVTQSIPAIFFLSLGILFFLNENKNRQSFSYIGTICLGLSAYAYHNTRVLAPIIFLVLLILLKKFFLAQKKLLVMLCIIAGIFFLPLGFILTSKAGTARGVWVAILDQGAINSINEARGQSRLPEPLPRIINNKISYFSSKAAINYLGYFSPVYLGFEGGTQYQLSLPHFGLIYPIELPFFYIGLIFLIFNFKKLTNFKKFILIWLLLAPIPAAVTRDIFHVGKSTTMLPVLYLVTLLGLEVIFITLKKINAKIIPYSVVTLIVLIIFFFGRYEQNYFFYYPRDYSFAWQYGYQQAYSYVSRHQSDYSQIVITKKYGEPHEFFLFYNKYDPESYRDDPKLVRYEQSNWFWVDGFSKYVFMNDWEIKQKLAKSTNILLVTSPGNYPSQAKLLDTIYFLDGKPAFNIVSL